MKNIIMKGRNVEEAKKMALEVLGLTEEAADFKVIKEGKSGVLGLGSEEAEVEAWEKTSLGNTANFYLQEILNKIGFMAISELGSETEERIGLNIKGDDLGSIIGKDGAMLNALQIILGVILSKKAGKSVKIDIDAEGYRERHKTKIEKMAKEITEEVIRTGIQKTLMPMSPADRRLIHLFLQENNKVETYSVGEGRDRSIVIAPKIKK